MTIWKIAGICVVASATVGCSDGGAAPQTQEEDLAQYEAMREDFEANRTVFLDGPAQDFTGSGETLFWVEAAAGDPRLHSFDNASKKTTDYTFKVFLTSPSAPSPIDNLNYSASSSLIATMNVLDGANTYSVGQPEGALGKLTLPAPPFGQKWWAYGVSGGDVYVTVIENEKYMLQKWTPGAAAPTSVLALDDLIAPNVMGEFHNFAVSGTTLVFDEGNRIWLADLSDAKAKWAQNDKHVGGVDFYAGGVVYSQDKTFFRYDAATDSREDLTEKILGGYTLNKTFAEAHYPVSNATWCKYKNKIVYEGNYGLFAYDMDSESVEPLLLDARDNSVVYKNPIALDSGTLFVKGLLSKSGSIGADGPTYSLAPANLN